MYVKVLIFMFCIVCINDVVFLRLLFVIYNTWDSYLLMFNLSPLLV